MNNTESSDEDDVPLVLDPNMKPYGLSQTIQFSGNEETNSTELNARDVTIIPSSGEHETGSSKLKVKSLVDFSWEFRYYMGQLLALHITGKYLAYALKTVGKNGGMVRVVNRESGNRTLLKKMDGMVQDIAFAHIKKQVIIANVDEFGTLFVHRIDENSYDTITCSILLHIMLSKPSPINTCHRVFWCPYEPEEDDHLNVPFDVDSGKLLCLTHGSRAQIFNVGMIHERFGVEPLNPSQLLGSHGYLEINEHAKSIIDAAFSPDGSAVALASQDGFVKFFQVDVNHTSPIRCLHEWQPHKDKLLSSMMFVDNHKNFVPHPDATFWKFAITGADNNTELKLWSCQSWQCIQTVRFTPFHKNKKIVLKVGIYLGGDYLLLSDISNKLLYVMQIYTYPAPYQKVAYIRSITEFLLPYPILSFAIIDAGIRKFKSPSLEDLSNNDDGDEELGQYIQALVVRMYLVQPKSLQECNLSFQPPILEEGQDQQANQLDSLSMSHEPLIRFNNDGLSDLSLAADNSMTEDSILPDMTNNHKAQQFTLLAPNAFTSPGKDSPTNHRSPQMPHHSESSPPAKSKRILESKISSSPTLGIGPQHIDSLGSSVGSLSVGGGKAPLATSDRFNREGFASGGSSPSREVQEILSSNNSDHNSYYDEKDMASVQAAVAKLHLMASPIADNLNFEMNDKENAVQQANAAERDGWPPIPISLVNDARNSVGDNRRSLGSEKSPVIVYVSPIDKQITKETLYNLFATDKSTPKSILLKSCDGATNSPGMNMAIIEYDNLRDAELVIRDFHNKAPNFWTVELEQSIDACKMIINMSSYADANLRYSLPQSMEEQMSGLGTNIKDEVESSSRKANDNSNIEVILQSLNTKVASLIESNESQQTQIKVLTSEVSALRKLSAERDKSPRHKSLISQIDKLLTQSRNETAVQFQEYLVTKIDQDRKKQEENFLMAISQLVNTAVTSRLPGMVEDEVQSVVLPQLSNAILKVVEPMQEKLQLAMIHQLTAIEHNLKQHIVQLVHSKTVTDILSQSAVVAMRPATQNCFTETYNQTIMPRFEKACQIMFKQVNDTFTKGTQEFIQTLDSHLKKQQQQQDSAQHLMKQLQSLSEAIHVCSQQIQAQRAAPANSGQEVSLQLQKGLQSMQETLTKCVRDNVKEHMTKCFQRQQAAIETKVLEAVRCITPAPHIVDSQTHILQLIAQEDINGAFQMALSASDLGLVVLVCEKVDPESLFSQTPCPLQQNVLLSLIQQLSADMQNHTDTKHRYLLEAIMNLDPRNPETRGHIPSVISRLQHQLNIYIASSSNTKMTSKVKQLLFSTRALHSLNI